MTDATNTQGEIWDQLEGDLNEGHEEHSHDMRGKFTDAIAARQHMRAGKSTITLVSLASGTRFTYKLNTSEDGNTIFVKLLVGPDNYSNYKYLGRIWRDIFFAGRKTPQMGDISPQSPGSKAFAWAWKMLAQERIPEQLEIWHEGKCGRCGRKLTVPESIANGFGPECIGRVAEGR